MTFWMPSAILSILLAKKLLPVPLSDTAIYKQIDYSEIPQRNEKKDLQETLQF